jgi:hypothetical protein
VNAIAIFSGVGVSGGVAARFAWAIGVLACLEEIQAATLRPQETFRHE